MSILGLATLFIQFHPSSRLDFYTDQTARGGATVATMTDEPGQVRLQGTLYGLILEDGTRRGFAGVRLRVSVPVETEQFVTQITNAGPNAVTVRALAKTSNVAPVPYRGELTYQTPFKLAPAETRELKIELKQMIPVVRGEDLDAQSVPVLRANDIREFGIEVRVTDQTMEPGAAAPEFDLLLR